MRFQLKYKDIRRGSPEWGVKRHWVTSLFFKVFPLDIYFIASSSARAKTTIVVGL